ncbi:hypothetical protein UVI_02045310 [Ustilaginoidea virens]|nr:hypothetical protein UVI_02045310 [Ustilaginoidea virens]
MTYVANASNFRLALLNTFADPNWEWKEVSKVEDVCLTYRGYIKFLETDLADVYPLREGRTKSKYKRGVEYIAKHMMARGNAFATAVRQRYKDHVRLSIHQSTGATKIPISLLPTETTFTTPWHCSVAYKVDGTVVSGMRADFDNDATYELVTENGIPSYYREKSPLFSWDLAQGAVSFEPIYPCGWMVRPAGGPEPLSTLSINDVDAKKVRSLAEVNSPVVLRGFFESPKKEAFIEKAKEVGEPQPWSFGLLLEVKDRGSDSRGLNNTLSAELMPFHYDGLFKTAKRVDDNGEEILASLPPKFQFFAGVTPSPPDSGYTLFSSSTAVFKHIPKWMTVEDLSSKTWTAATPCFGSAVLRGLPLVVPHPTTGRPCLRYHEPWPQSKTKFDPTRVSIDHEDEATSQAICEAINSTLRDRRVAYYHAWKEGDLLLSDNTLALHTRSAFLSGSDRELWRIHLD